MKKSIMFISLLLTSPCLLAEPVNLSITNINSSNGQIVVRVYDNKANWMSDKADEITLEQAFGLDAVENNRIDVSLELPQGNYSLYLFHDLDNNNEMAANWLGIPKEPVGTSNNAKGFMGPPSFDDANFTVTSEQNNLAIKLADL
ncbi:DUF2141 domain-containing protein [Colwellia sp. MEBiC06753]